jgi:hypothetical protein
VEDVLQQALEPVLRDLRTAGVRPRIEDSDWAKEWDEELDRASAMLWGRLGGLGIAVARWWPDADQIVCVAEQVQEWAVEELWTVGASTSWPECPHHPAAHPMEASLIRNEAWWACPHYQSPVARIGQLTDLR